MRRFLLALGPAIIVASVVLGPGSILTSSRVGTEYGYQMLWVLVGVTILLIGTVALAGRLGVSLGGTMCDELAARLGRPVAATVGLIVFLIVASFQTSNNVAVLAAVEPLLAAAPGVEGPGAEAAPAEGGVFPILALLVLNAVVIGALFGLRKLYAPIETLMMLLVLVMIVGFAANLAFARPSILGMLGGLIPRLPAEVADGIVPYKTAEGVIVDPIWAVTGMIATTLSIAGAFYQAYLVREKGLNIGQAREGLIDSVAGIAVLGAISMVVMVTSAAVLHGVVESGDLRSASDVARQLEPAFGRGAMVLFSLGIFAGAFSSFLVNAMIGGTLLADGLGLGGRMDQTGTKVFTTAALLIAMVIALATSAEDRVGVIIFAQALTVVGLPALALTLIYLATRPEMSGERRVPRWMLVIASIVLVLTLLMAARTGWRVYLVLAG